MIFDSVTYREPRKLRRPDRDAVLSCILCGLRLADELPIFLDHAPADAIERHALSNTSVELGGILLGWECVDETSGEPFVWITQALEARHYENTQASFTYTHDSWEEITRDRERLFPELDVVGWYHTHPGFGIFLSSHDLFIHEHFFTQELQVAYVVDPIRQTRGFFQWQEKAVEAVSGFQVVGKREDRVSLARFVNELESLPSGVSGGGSITGGLSPRLEAQLIAMLNRPPQTLGGGTGSGAGSPWPLLFGLLGVMLGGIGMAVILWMGGFSRQLEEQSGAIAGLQGVVSQRLEEPMAERLAAKEEALDALLGSIELADTGESVLDAYRRVTLDRDEARLELKAIETDKSALNALASQLQSERKGLDAELAAARARAEELKTDLGQLIETQRQTLSQNEATLSIQKTLIEETEAGVLTRKYRIAWYTAAVSLGACVLLALGLVWSIARQVPGEEGQQEVRIRET